MSADIDRARYLLSVADMLYKTVGSMIIIISTIGNLLNCFVFSCIPALNKHPNALFIIAASVGSLIFIDIGLIPPVLKVFTGITLSNLSLFWCKTSTWATYSAGCFSLMCSCFAALGQFLITLSRIQWQRLITRIRARLMIILTAISWLLIFLPLLIYYNISLKSTCTASQSFIIVYSTYWMMIGYYLLPILIILVLFFLTWYNLRQLLRRRRSLEGVVTRMMLIQMSILLMSGIPAGIYYCYMIITQYYVKSLLRIVYEVLILLVLNFFTLFTNGLSFWVFLFASKTFRKHLKDYFFQWKLCQNRVQHIFPPTTTVHVH